VKCWGTDNQRGKSGEALIFQATKPVDILFNPLAKKVVNGRNFACGLHTIGVVTCWGSNIFHQLGVTDADLKGNYKGVASVKGVRNATDVAASMFSACATDIDGEVTCWGMFAMEDPGAGGDLASVRKNFTQLPTVVEGLRDVEQVAVGGGFACALVWSGAIKCWGRNKVGQLGNGTFANSPAPVDVLDFPLNSIK
jgi:alpha-tubulin suppressor-like RCC1 family protein